MALVVLLFISVVLGTNVIGITPSVKVVVKLSVVVVVPVEVGSVVMFTEAVVLEFPLDKAKKIRKL